MRGLILVCCATAVWAFVPITPISKPVAPTSGLRTTTRVQFFFGSDPEKERRKQEDFERQQEILRLRQDPKKLQKYYKEVSDRRQEVNKNVKEKFDLSQGGKQNPAIKWMELRRQGKIPDREKYENQETNRGIVIPQVPFGKPKYDDGLRFDLRAPYVDEGYVDESASLGASIARLFGFGKPSKPTTLPDDGYVQPRGGPSSGGSSQQPKKKK